MKNLEQTKTNERQIKDVLQSLGAKEEMIRSLFTRLHEVVQSVGHPMNEPHELLMPRFAWFKVAGPTQDVFGKFTKFQIVLTYLSQLQNQKPNSKQQGKSGVAFRHMQAVYGSNPGNQMSQNSVQRKISTGAQNAASNYSTGFQSLPQSSGRGHHSATASTAKGLQQSLQHLNSTTNKKNVLPDLSKEPSTTTNDRFVSLPKGDKPLN